MSEKADFRRLTFLNWITYTGQETTPILGVDPIDANGYELHVKVNHSDTTAVKTLTSAGGGIIVDATSKQISILLGNDIPEGDYVIELRELTQAAPYDQFYVGTLEVLNPYEAKCP